MTANAEGLEWRQARQYLIQSGVIPPTHRVTKPDVDLVDFARSLRDGVFLCSLLNKMKPNCVEDWSPKPLMQVPCSQHCVHTHICPVWRGPVEGEGARVHCCSRPCRALQRSTEIYTTCLAVVEHTRTLHTFMY